MTKREEDERVTGVNRAAAAEGEKTAVLVWPGRIWSRLESSVLCAWWAWEFLNRNPPARHAECVTQKPIALARKNLGKNRPRQPLVARRRVLEVRWELFDGPLTPLHYGWRGIHCSGSEGNNAWP